MRSYSSLLTVSIAASLSLLGQIRPSYAEGSVNLYPNGATGNRGNIEWRQTTDGRYGGLIARRSVFKVYAQAGESILLGSSAKGITSGTNTGDILLYSPGTVTGPRGGETFPTTPALSCNTQANPAGQITSRAQELAGPTPNVGGYTPCIFTAPTTGVYDVVFTGPGGFNATGDGGVTGSIAQSTNNFNATQGSSVSTWDVTVRTDPNNPATTRSGRLFTYALVAFLANNGRSLNSTVYPVTIDGYRYQTNFKGLDPNGFVAFGNRSGFLNTDGTPLYRDVLAATGTANVALVQTIQGGATMAPPEFPIFLSNTNVAGSDAPTVLTALGITNSPLVPTVTNLQFAGTSSGSTSLQNTGGTFTFNTNIDGSYELIISADGVDFDPTNTLNRVIRQQLNAPGNQSILWDGKRNDGTFFPVNPPGGSYPVRVSVRGGEYHFPLLDAENSVNGGPSFTVLNPPGSFAAGFTPTTAFYDDRGYQLANGTVVGTAVNGPLCPTGTAGNSTQPNPVNSNTLTGFNSTGLDRRFGTASGGNSNVTSCAGSFGDAKGLDLWTYFPSQFTTTNVVIVPATQPRPTATKFVERIVDADNSNSLTGGDRIRYTITYANSGTAAASNFQITDVLPAGLTYVPGSITVTPTGAGTTAIANTAYAGTTASPNLLGANAVLGINGTIVVTIEANIGAVTGNLFNQANGTSNTPGFPAGGLLTDTRDATTSGIPNSSIDQSVYPTGTTTDPTGITIGSPRPILNKAVRRLRDNDNTGTLTPGDDLEYIIVARNPNTVAPINNLVLSDIVPTQVQFLRDAANPITITGVPFTVATSLPATSFNGAGAPAIALTQPGTLPAGGTVTLRFNARIRAGAASPIANQALVNYQGDLGIPVRSDGSDSTNPGTSGSGTNPGIPDGTGQVNQANAGPEDETIVAFVLPINPVGTKSVRVLDDRDGSGGPSIGDVIEYTVIYQNTSTTTAVNNFQLSDPIDGANLAFLPGSYTFTASSAATTVTGRNTFNGTTEPIASEIGTLAPGDSITVTFAATITAPPNTVIRNQASAVSNGPISPSLTDAVSGPQDIPQLIDDGTETGNEATNPGDDEPNLLTVRAPGNARLKLLKRITGATRSGDSLPGLNFTQTVNDDPIVTDLNAAGLTAFGLPEIPATTPLRSGDEVEYTIYFLSDGSSFAQNTTLCDLIPAGTTFVPNSYGSSRGVSLRLAGTTSAQTNATDADRGSFTPALAPLPSVNGCSNATNPNGAAIVSLGTVSNLAPNQVGFFRFRVRVN